MMLLIQKRGVTTIAQGRRDKHTTSPLWGQQQAVTPNARGIQPIARAAPPTLSPAANATAYSGIDEMLAREGICQEKTKTVAELKWQSKIAKDKDKIKKFLDNVLQVRGFHAFLFMTKESCFVRMAHSVAKFTTVNPTAGEVDEKIFAFIGNRLIDQEPCAVLIPTNAWMAWANHKVGGNTKAMMDHYSNKANCGKLYQGPGGRATKHVPNILAILLSAVRLFELHKQGKMPHKCLEILINHINDPTMVDDKDKWNLVRNWLITATYSNIKKKKDRHVLGININPVTCNDKEVREWISQQIDKAIGPQQKSPPAILPPQQVANSTTFQQTHMPPMNIGLAEDIAKQ